MGVEVSAWGMNDLHLVMNEDFLVKSFIFLIENPSTCLLTRRITVHLIQFAKVNIGGKNLFRNILERAPNDNISPKIFTHH